MAEDEIVVSKGKLPREIGSHQTLQVAHTIVCEDASGTVKPSPLTLTTSVAALVPPIGAVTVTMTCTAIWWIGENTTLDGAATLKGYAAIPANAIITLPCRVSSVGWRGPILMASLTSKSA